jgi:hypothetical protein
MLAYHFDLRPRFLLFAREIFSVCTIVHECPSSSSYGEQGWREKVLKNALAQVWNLIRFAHRELEMNCARVNKNHAIPSQRNKLRGRMQALHWGTVLSFDQRSLSG